MPASRYARAARGERAVVAGAVAGDVAGLRGEGDEGAAAGLDLRKAVAALPRMFGQRVVAAGVEEDQRLAVARLELLDDVVEPQRLLPDGRRPSALGVGRERDSWRPRAGSRGREIEEHDRLGAFASASNSTSVRGSRQAEIFRLEHVEAEPREGIGDGARIVDRVLQPTQPTDSPGCRPRVRCVCPARRRCGRADAAHAHAPRRTRGRKQENMKRFAVRQASVDTFHNARK